MLIKKINNLNVNKTDNYNIQLILIISKKMHSFINEYRDTIINMIQYTDIKAIVNNLIKTLNNNKSFLKKKLVC